jgi:hypothetical protein
MTPQQREMAGGSVLVLGALCMVSCGVLLRPQRDYAFGVTVAVVDEAQAPVPAATVKLALDAVVFEAITPVQSASELTNATGGCVFMYIAHQPSVGYSVTVEKEGYATETQTGVATREAHLKFLLRRKTL